METTRPRYGTHVARAGQAGANLRPTELSGALTDCVGRAFLSAAPIRLDTNCPPALRDCARMSAGLTSTPQGRTKYAFFLFESLRRYDRNCVTAKSLSPRFSTAASRRGTNIVRYTTDDIGYGDLG